jgi:hypothetical protein
MRAVRKVSTEHRTPPTLLQRARQRWDTRVRHFALMFTVARVVSQSSRKVQPVGVLS